MMIRPGALRRASPQRKQDDIAGIELARNGRNQLQLIFGLGLALHFDPPGAFKVAALDGNDLRIGVVDGLSSQLKQIRIGIQEQLIRRQHGRSCRRTAAAAIGNKLAQRIVSSCNPIFAGDVLLRVVLLRAIGGQNESETIVICFEVRATPVV